MKTDRKMFKFFCLCLIIVVAVNAELPADFCNGQPLWNSHPSDCSKYVMCWNGETYINSCPTDLYWDNTALVCNVVDQVDCNSEPATTKITTTKSSDTTTIVPDTTTTTKSIPDTTTTTKSIPDTTTTTKSIPDTTTTTASIPDTTTTTKSVPDTTTTTKSIPDTTTTTTVMTADFCDGKPLWNSHPSDCNKYIMCWNGVTYIKSCPAGLYWDNSGLVCNTAEFVDCISGPTDGSGPTITSNPATTTTGSPIGTCDISTCNVANGQGDDCWCIGENTPGNLPKSSTPKMVLLTFDDALSEREYLLFSSLFDGRTNPNGCPITTTYFVSDAYTDYDRVRDLFSKGHEMASHTLTHRTPIPWWKTATYDELVAEIVGQKLKLESEGITNVVGFRNPFLQTAGDTTFKVLKDNGFLYDTSLVTHFGKQWWPYTFNYGGPPLSECIIPPCPTNSYPGLWEIPMLQMKDTTALCSMFDSCFRYSSNTKEGVFEFFKTNFDRHYATNTAPFPLFAHASWMLPDVYAYRKEGLKMFLDYLKTRQDAYIVTIQKSIEWMRNPTQLSNIQKNTGPFSC